MERGFRTQLPVILTAILLMMTAVTASAFAVDGDAQRTVPATDVPVVYVEVDNSDGRADIADMNASEDHSVRCTGTVSIDASGTEAGFPLSDPDISCSSFDEMQMEIKGRGNTSWGARKKPYKIRLDSKKALLGDTLGKSRHWVLLANYYDRTLLKDRVTARLGADIGMEFTPRGVPVELMMKNRSDSDYTYYGSYYLSEQVRVEKSRVNIDELKETDYDDETISGGYLVQNGSQTDTSSLNYFETARGEIWANHTPDFDEADDDGTRYENDKQKNYIRSRMQVLEDALYAADYSGSGDSNYRNLTDLASAAKYWLVMQASMNADAYGTGSTYLYKKRGDDRMYWGPLWDFDYAWSYDQSYEGFQNNHKWVRAMLHDTAGGGFIKEVQKQWNGDNGSGGVRAELLAIAADGGIIDQYYEETKASQANDLQLYPVEVMPGGRGFDPETDREKFKTWIMNRVSWLDKQINDPDAEKYIGDLSHLVIMKDGDEELQREFLENGWSVLAYFSAPQKEGYIFTGWEDENGNEVNYGTVCTEDMVIIPKYVSKEDATKPADILLQYREYYAEYSEGGSFSIGYTLVPEDVQDDEVVWTSSDESVAKVSDASYGKFRVSMYKPGDAVITASLSTGVTRSVTVHITDGPLPAPDSVSTEKKVYEMTVGSYSQIYLLPDPARSKAGFVTYSVAEGYDGSVASVNDNGALRALAPGRTTITIKTETTVDSPEWHVVTNETSCEVIVSEKKDDGGDADEKDRSEDKDKDKDKGSGGGDPGKSDGSGGSTDKSGGGGRGANTGDGSALTGWTALAACSSAALAVMIRRRRSLRQN